MTIRIMKSELYATPIYIGSHSIICPICGVSSNPYPCYDEGDGTTVPHRMTYCGHLVEGNSVVIALPGIPKELGAMK